MKLKRISINRMVYLSWGENKPTRKMNHNQFNAFVEGIDFKVLPSGKIQKL